MMLYSKVADAYSRIESTSKRLEMTEIFVELLQEAQPEEVGHLVYLTQGKILPDFEGVELGMATTLALKALSLSSGADGSEADSIFRKTGDIGEVAKEIAGTRKQQTLYSEILSLGKVYKNFMEISKTTGPRSQEKKIKLAADLLHNATDLEAKYIMRSLVGTLRLGMGDMTIIDALAEAYALKEDRDLVETAYNISSDLGRVAAVLSRQGKEGLVEIKITAGIPLRPMLCERLPSLAEILEKLGGEAAFEYKYDGLRIQAHIADGEVRLFSRQLEDVTSQFPDIIDALKNSIREDHCIFEGECVPVDRRTDEFLPFQAVSHRRGRVHDIEGAVKEYPVVLFLFDCLLVGGRDLTNLDYNRRREELLTLIKPSDMVRLATSMQSDQLVDVETFFAKAVESGCEGIIAKSIQEDSTYRAGARGWQWIKFKTDYGSEMVDTVDLVVIGGFHGKGRRAGMYGALLMAAINPSEDRFESICKLGTGFTDEILEALPGRLDSFISETKPMSVNSKLIPDVWFEPNVVMEVLGSELTLSTIHTCAYDMIKERLGLAIRFPRFTGRFREDKGIRDATSSEELVNMYQKQLKQVK